MLGVLADKMVERGEIHVILFAYNIQSQLPYSAWKTQYGDGHHIASRDSNAHTVQLYLR